MLPRYVVLALAALATPLPAAHAPARPATAPGDAGQGAVNARTPRPDELDYARRLIDEALADERASAGSVAARLSELGPDGLPLAWALLWAPPVGQRSPLVERGIPTRQVLRELALAVPRRGLADFLRGLLAHGAGTEVRAWGLDLLAQVGTGRELPLVLDLGTPAGPAGGDHDEPAPGLRAALVSVLRRDAQAFRVLRGEAAAQLTASVVHELLAALVEVGDVHALNAIGDLLGAGQADELEVLDALAQVGRTLAPPFDPYLLRKLQQRTDDGDPERCARVVRVLEALGDEASIPRLLELLQSSDAIVRGAAHAALKGLTGLGFSCDPRRWQVWHAEELRWWEDDSARVLADLQSADEPLVVAALAQVVTRRLHRTLLAREVACLLGSDSALLRRLACSSLAQLASAAPAHELVQRLDDVDPSVSLAAHQALVQIFDQPLFPDPEPWLLYLNAQRRDLR